MSVCPVCAGHVCVCVFGRVAVSLIPPPSPAPQIFSQISNEFEMIDSGGVPFLMQEVSSWGAVFFPRRWREFLSW